MSIGYMIRRADGTQVGPFFTSEEAKHYLQPGDVPFAYNDHGDVIERGPQFDELCSTCDGSGDETMDSMLAVGVPGGQYPIGPCPDCGGTGFYVPTTTPTIDDMLARLVADQVTSVRTQTWGAPGQKTRSFVAIARGGRVVAETSADTLHAAMAAAVDQVEP